MHQKFPFGEAYKSACELKVIFMSELDDQRNKPGGTPDHPADTDGKQEPGRLPAAICLATAYFTLATSLPTVPDKSPEQPSFPKDPPYTIAAPAQRDRGNIIPPEDDGIDRRKEAEEMTEGLIKYDRGKPI
jgi:hypothetical protein